MRTTIIRFVLATTLVGGIAALSGCEEKGPAETAGKKVDDAMKDAGKAIDDAADDAKKKIDEAAKNIEGK